jgi:hypothetical protein
MAESAEVIRLSSDLWETAVETAPTFAKSPFGDFQTPRRWGFADVAAISIAGPPQIWREAVILAKALRDEPLYGGDYTIASVEDLLTNLVTCIIFNFVNTNS